jgi:hypothetical protein
MKGFKMANNERRVGTVSRGIRCPIIREGDDLAKIVTDSVLEAAQYEGFEIHEKDVISMTESIVARAQGNYASCDDIALGMPIISILLSLTVYSKPTALSSSAWSIAQEYSSGVGIIVIGSISI